MSSLLLGHPIHSATFLKTIASPKLPVALLANLAMAAAFLASSGLVLFALHSALTGN